MSSSNATHHEWLPMPSGISLTPHNSFTKDLLSQFDRRRSQYGLSIQAQQQQSRSQSVDSSSNSNSLASSSMTNTPSSISSSNSIQEGQQGVVEYNVPLQEELEEKTSNNRRRSAGDLLRKSSLYLRNKFLKHSNANNNNTAVIEREIADPSSSKYNSWTVCRKKKLHVPLAKDIFNTTNDDDKQLSRVAINTTINISTSNNTNTNTNTNTTTTILQPPIITQYPPKPLKYSPVEPLPNEPYAGTAIIISNNNSNRRKTLHRLSLPLLKLTAANQPVLQRRRSDSDLLNNALTESSQQKTGLLRSISKQWNKLIKCKRNFHSNNNKKNIIL